MKAGATRHMHRIGAGHHADRPLVGGVEQHDAAEAGIAADAHDTGVGDDVEIHRAQEMRGLVDRAHRPVAVPGRRAGDHHGGVGERHQRLAAHHRAVGADLLGERQPHGGARLPIRRRARRAGRLDAFDKQRQILDPRRETPRSSGAPPPAVQKRAAASASRCTSPIANLPRSSPMGRRCFSPDHRKLNVDRRRATSRTAAALLSRRTQTRRIRCNEPVVVTHDSRRRRSPIRAHRLFVQNAVIGVSPV